MGPIQEHKSLALFSSKQSDHRTKKCPYRYNLAKCMDDRLIIHRIAVSLFRITLRIMSERGSKQYLRSLFFQVKSSQKEMIKQKKFVSCKRKDLTKDPHSILDLHIDIRIIFPKILDLLEAGTPQL